jgi:hypothetical protein
MSKFTDFLNLFKWDSIADAEEEFNIDKALNENWDKIDTKLKTYITNLQANKVDKEDGKNLSTNDYTNKEKEKLNNIESNAQVNLIEKIQKNGIDIDIINKIVNLTLTKNDVGLDNVDNTSDIDKPLSNAAITELAKKLDKTSKATSTEAIAGTNNTKYTTPYSVKSAIDKALEGYTPSGGGKKEVGYADEQLEGTEVILIEDSDFNGENSVELAKVEQNLTSNSENTVPSVKAVNDGIKTNIITGQEVATNEYVDGKRVYLKRIEFTLPTTLGTWESIAQLDNTVDTIIYKELRFKVNNEEYDIPYSYNNEAISCYFNTNTKRLYINQNYGYPKGKSGWGILKYTKNT